MSHVTLSDGVLLQRNNALPGSESVWFAAGVLRYRLPAPLGRWIESYGQVEVAPLKAGGGLASDFPYPCAPGLVGSDDQTATQSGPQCSGLCDAGHT